MSDPTSHSATDLAATIRARRLSAVEVVRAHLERIERLNPSLNAVIHLEPERAMEAAVAADATRDSSGPLHGVPVTLKDSHRVAGMPTIVGNPDAPARPASRNGFVADRLRSAGAIVVGKTNVARDLADFQTDNPVFGRTNNPWDVSRTPGGSSGGAAAAVSARMTPLEVGSDIAGSIRVPAHFTGVIGLKPSAGLVSRRGHVTQPVRHPRGGGVGTLAAIGPIARTFDDIALLLEILGGPRADEPFDPRTARIGIVEELPGLLVEIAIRDAVIAVGAAAERNGMRVEFVEPPSEIREQHDAYVAAYQAARDRGARWRGDPDVARLLPRVRRAWNEALRTHDAIVCPPAMCAAFTHRPTGSPIPVDGVDAPYWGLTRYAEPFNLTGLPAIVFPVGLNPMGMPIGVQVVAGFGRDGWLIRAAEWLAADWLPLPSPIP